MAAAAVHHNMYYDTLTELDNDAKQLIKHHFDPMMASRSIIVSIFSKQVPMEQLMPSAGRRPVIIITAGSPGVGKSTVAKKQFKEFDVDPDHVYTVSMDALLEHNRLFRNKTKELYNKWHAIKGEFTNANYATFSAISTAAYAAKQGNLKIPEKIGIVNRKYAEQQEKQPNMELIAALHEIDVSGPKRVNKSRKKQPILRATSRSPVRSPAHSPARSPPRSPPKNTSVRRSSRLAAKTPHKGGAIDYDLDDIREIGFEFGVANGLNILYDCTLTKTGRRMASIMNILEKYAKKGGPKYEIKVLLIKAHDNIDEAARIIQQRIKGRHYEMVRNGYLRALTTSIGAIKNMITMNKDGFDAAYNIYKESGEIVNPPYEPDDFEFKEIENKPRNS